MRQPGHPGRSRRAPAQILLIFGLGVFGLVALIALVLDGGNVYVQRRTTQLAADAAALAGARELRGANASTPVSVIAAAITSYAQANAFGVAPMVLCAYFVGTDGVSALGTIVNTSGPSCPAGTVSTIPSAASGVHVDKRVSFQTYLVGMLKIATLDADGHATAQIGVLTGADTRSSPLIVCGGGGGTGYDALQLAVQTPVVVTTTPGVLAATPASLPVVGDNPNVTTSQLLVTPAAGAPPAYVANGAADGTIYYIKGQKISTSNGSNCGASGFHGAAAPSQPTPYIQDVTSATPAVIVGQSGNSVPQISQQVASSGACVAGTDPSNQWSQGQPGCVMILPLVDGSNGITFNIQAWGAFYVWCVRTTGSGCQEFAGQYLANWPIAGGLSTNIWTFGSGGGITVIHLTG